MAGRPAARPLVIIESPFAGDTPLEKMENANYLKRILRDSLGRGEAPFASHAIYPCCLNDDDPEQRRLGMSCGYDWMTVATKVVFYVDRGVSKGMNAAKVEADRRGKPIEIRRLDDPTIGNVACATLNNDPRHWSNR